MTYIYPITDPEILKLGFRMALYREKRPIDILPAKKEIEALREWQKSRIAYLKEPEFKVGDVFYLTRNTDFGGIIEYGRDYNYKLITHYKSGQEVESFKYVREVEYENTLDRRSSALQIYSGWEEVEEPVKMMYSKIEEAGLYSDGSTDSHQHAKFNPIYTQFQEGVKKGEIIAEI